MKKTRVNRNLRVRVPCFGGPYDGGVIALSHGVERTLTFTAKGMTGHYRRDGKWEEKSR